MISIKTFNSRRNIHSDDRRKGDLLKLRKHHTTCLEMLLRSTLGKELLSNSARCATDGAREDVLSHSFCSFSHKL